MTLHSNSEAIDMSNKYAGCFQVNIIKKHSTKIITNFLCCTRKVLISTSCKCRIERVLYVTKILLLMHCFHTILYNRRKNNHRVKILDYVYKNPLSHTINCSNKNIHLETELFTWSLVEKCLLIWIECQKLLI